MLSPRLHRWFALGVSTAAARLTEASTRYSFNKTGMELLYLPLPLDLRNRTKAFVDVFVDRFARGLGGMILVLATSVLAVPVKFVAVIVMVFSLAWIVLSVYAKKEYIATVRKRLELRRLDIESARVSVDDPATIAMLEQTAPGRTGGRPYTRWGCCRTRTATTLAVLPTLAQSGAAEVRAQAYEIAGAAKDRICQRRQRGHPAGEAGNERRSGSLRRGLCFGGSEDRQAVTGLVEPSEPAGGRGRAAGCGEQADRRSEIDYHEWLSAAAGDPIRRSAWPP